MTKMTAQIFFNIFAKVFVNRNENVLPLQRI